MEAENCRAATELSCERPVEPGVRVCVKWRALRWGYELGVGPINETEWRGGCCVELSLIRAWI